MNNDLLTYQIGLVYLNGIGPKRAKTLISKLGSVEAIFLESSKTLQNVGGLTGSLIKSMNREIAMESAREQVEFILKNKIRTHFFLDTNYPRRLKQCDDAPLLLFSKGNFEVNATRTVAVVGTRSATDYGKSLCEELISSLKETKIQVISGMAYGIDICVHQLCVKNNIETLGVLGHGLDRLYPSEHRRTAELMYDNGGLLTEFFPGTKPDRENFPMRNRIVAGMSDATIVIESKKSGGSLITAQLANDYNRDVFAYPGNVGQQYSEGCNRLIQKDQAHLVLSGEDFLNQMNWLEQKASGQAQRSIFIDLSEKEKLICEQLENKSGEHVDVISHKCGLPISEINVELFHMEMKGLVKPLPGKKYMLI